MNNIKVLNDLKDFNYKLVLIKIGRHIHGDRFALNNGFIQQKSVGY